MAKNVSFTGKGTRFGVPSNNNGEIIPRNKKYDQVDFPAHYTDGSIEVIDFIEDKKMNFNRGNAIKYISRAGKKIASDEITDLQKAVWYLEREIKSLQKQLA